MYIIFFLIWVIFNGQLTVEIALLGLVVSGAMYAFICRFMDYRPGKDLVIARKIFCFLHYIGVLLKEIIKANYIVIKKVASARYEISSGCGWNTGRWPRRGPAIPFCTHPEAARRPAPQNERRFLPAPHLRGRKGKALPWIYLWLAI